MQEEVALSSILGASVYDSSGAFAGQVREVAISPQEDPNRISDFVVRTPEGDRLLPARQVKTVIGSSIQVIGSPHDWPPLASSAGMLLLERDLLDQQIIDVSGRKVVRVNDVDFWREPVNGAIKLKVGRVDIGLRGAIRRLLKGLAPSRAIEALATRMPEKSIPWEAVDLIETDPSRRVHLKLEYERLSRLHPADIADILEELAPAEREAVFGSLDEEVAAEALEEIDPKMQIELMRSIDSDRAADIVEEMDPDAAADLLGDLPAETSEEILEEMEPEERQEVSELLAFEENTAAGRMTTEFIALSPEHTVGDAIDRLRSFEGAVETISTIYLVDQQERLVGSVPLVSLVLAPGGTRLGTLSPEHVIYAEANASDRDVAEMFDKYNLATLPVVDEEQRLAGIITADDIISLLRDRI
ncbi:MAG TPA: CBS domain-containing protein [Candidatus Angelobacter sp.]|jgi:CBS domain-containing protein/sporulation protein YlmC with PRC-barrel domain